MIERIDANTEVSLSRWCRLMTFTNKYIRTLLTTCKAPKENYLSTGREFQGIAGWWLRCLVF